MLAVVLVVLAALPAGATADAPWNGPVPVERVSSTTALLTTQLGGRILVGASIERTWRRRSSHG